MNDYYIYKFIEFAIFSMYLIFIFLAVQIWFIWKDIDKKELEIKDFINESFFKKNCLYVFAFSISFMLHEIIEGINPPNAAIFFELFEMLGFSVIVLFAYEWYMVLRSCANKKSLPEELLSPNMRNSS